MPKLDFIKNEIFILTISGAFGHNSIYKVDVAENDKIKFRNSIKSFLKKVEDEYKNKVTGDRHLVILENLKKQIEAQGENILKGTSISFGTVQKILNLYLKYLWCLGLITEPPNCPIDRIILNKMKDYKTNWTQMDREDYRRTIEKIKLIKGEKSIAEWELSEFKRK